MKFTKISLVCLGALALFGCNMGGTTGSDVQNKSVSGGAGTSNSYSMSLTATGCQSITSNGGTCSVVLAYTGVGNYAGKLPVFASGITGYGTNINTACDLASSQTSNNNPCTITITSNNGTNTSNHQTPIITLGGTDAVISFNLGGGL